jgi:glycosyltransferase involved in cell wall biosynthesis
LNPAIMRILLVGNYTLDNQPSMQGYADMLRRHLITRGHHVEIIRPRPILGKLLAQPTLRKWLGYVDKYVFFPFELRSRIQGFDLVHVCDHSQSMYLQHTGDTPASITCHDLLAIGSAFGRYPQQKISFTGRMQQRWILKHLSGATNVICVSANTAQELATFSGGTVQKIAVIPNALNFNFTPASEQSILNLRNRLGFTSDERYLFHIGIDAWYKNRLGVLRIYKSLLDVLRVAGDPPLRLVIAGGRFSQKMRDYITSNLVEGRVVEIVNPSNEDLRALYSGATALLFPSLFEGFGWPLIEAQSCGCPVITSNRAPMTEVAGSAALYIDPGDEQAAATAIAANLSRLAMLREAGFHNARRFDPTVILPAYEEFFATAAQTKRRTK